MDKKPEALSAAFFDAKAKLKKIKQFGITPDMSQEAKDKLVEDLSTAKALADQAAGGDAKVADFRNGQDWYVESLVEFSGMTPKQQLDACYEQKFVEQATENELLAMLEDMGSEQSGAPLQ